MRARTGNPVDVAVGARIRNLRLRNKLSQEEVGRRLKISFQQVQKYEKGVNRIGAGRLLEVARILNVPIDFFYEGLSGAGDQPGAGESAPVMEFVSSGEGLQLSLAFMKIKDAKVRKRFLDLVKSLAEDEEQKN